MTTTSNPQTIIRRLKKEVHLLHRKEIETKNQLKTVFSELKDLGKAYEKKAAANLKKMKVKLAAGQAGPFLKAIGDVEKKFLGKITGKENSLSTIVGHIEKKMAGHFAKVSKPKAKKTKSTKKAKRKA